MEIFMMKLLNTLVFLAKLELSEEEKEQAKADMGKMLDYIDKLKRIRHLRRRADVPCIPGQSTYSVRTL